MIKVRKDNVIYKINEESFSDYEKMGFKKINDKGEFVETKVSKEKVSKEVAKQLEELNSKVAELTSEKDNLVSEKEELNSKVAELTSKIEELTKEEKKENK